MLTAVGNVDLLCTRMDREISYKHYKRKWAIY